LGGWRRDSKPGFQPNGTRLFVFSIQREKDLLKNYYPDAEVPHFLWGGGIVGILFAVSQEAKILAKYLKF
jgi:hypothetical protein